MPAWLPGWTQRVRGLPSWQAVGLLGGKDMCFPQICCQEVMLTAVGPSICKARPSVRSALGMPEGGMRAMEENRGFHTF